MSLVPTYVKTQSGIFLKNPVIEGVGWFICFDDNDPPEIVIADYIQETPEGLLDAIPIKHSEPKLHSKCQSDFKGKLKGSRRFYFDLKSRLPDIPVIGSYICDGVRLKPDGDCVIYKGDR